MDNKPPGRRIGYARVSLVEQNLDFQIRALKDAGCDLIFSDHGISGADKHRPEFERALAEVGGGDTLVVWKLDRMSRSLKHLIQINDAVTEAGGFIDSLTEKIDTASPMGQFVFHILAAVAELELSIIRERTKAGLEAAAAKGRYPGRPRKIEAY